MKIAKFLQLLSKTVDAGCIFALHEGINLRADGSRQRKWMIRCIQLPETELRCAIDVIEALAVLATRALPGDGWISCCRRLRLSLDDGGMIIRAADQIVVFDKGEEKPRVKHSTRLRADLLKACNLEEKP